MSAQAFRNRWLGWAPGGAISSPADKNPLTELTEAPRRPPSVSSVSRIASAGGKITDLVTDGAPAAVLLRGTVWGDVWLIANDDVLRDHPDIATSGLPIVRYVELPHLQRLDAASLQSLGIVKRTFPTSTVLQ